MTESEARTKPISEVWGRFIDVMESIPFYDARIAATGDTKHYGGAALAYKEEFPMLRAVLLERCELFPSNAPAKGQSLVEYHTECAAWHSFWAWELKQRENESNG